MVSAHSDTSQSARCWRWAARARSCSRSSSARSAAVVDSAAGDGRSPGEAQENKVRSAIAWKARALKLRWVTVIQE
jgi:hypothetical protein